MRAVQHLVVALALSVTGVSERQLPNEVTAAPAAWALSILSDRAKLSFFAYAAYLEFRNSNF